LAPEFPKEISQEKIVLFLDWLQEYSVPAIGLLGGEPTMHSQFESILAQFSEIGIAVVLFTNGIFPKKLVDPIAKHTVNVVVNYNDPSMYKRGQLDIVNQNLKALASGARRLTFSKNFSPGHTSVDYLIEACKRYGVRHVRYDISRPGDNRQNDYFSIDKTKDIVDTVINFVEQCHNLGIRTGMDCCIPLCQLSASQRRFMEKISTKFSGICHPSIDVHPDLSVSYCLPLKQVMIEDVTSMPGEDALIRYFAESVKALRALKTFDRCGKCDDFGKRCQGGCLALKNTT
jgi:MoaA/NifB/PqqE/SkfB family radical SAM enzyme